MKPDAAVESAGSIGPRCFALFLQVLVTCWVNLTSIDCSSRYGRGCDCRCALLQATMQDITVDGAFSSQLAGSISAESETLL